MTTLGCGASLQLPEVTWRLLIQQAWLVGLLQRNMRLGYGHSRITSIVFNTYRLTDGGERYLESPTTLSLPAPTSDQPSSDIASISRNGSPKEVSHPKLTRKSKGMHMLPVLRKLLSSQDKWFEIEESDDYHYPGVFHCPHPQRLGFAPDITKLPFYVEEDMHFLFNDIQLGKGKPREPRKVCFMVNGKEEELFYRIAPCGGVKRCSFEGCSYTVSTREHHSCPSHPEVSLTCSEECPVEFVYVWPEHPGDKRRWLTGIRRTDQDPADNLHNHPLHGPSKIPSKVVHDIQKKLKQDPTLKTHDIVTGKLIN